MDPRSVEAGNWWAASRGAASGAWIEQYRRSLNARHRTLIVEQVKGVGAETLLEVGCHCGPNLIRLAQEFPQMQMIGVDISEEAIAAGKAWAKQQGVHDRVQLNAGRIPQMLYALPSKSCDVVMSCYALAYIAPADLDAVLYEMGRIAIKAVMLAEPMHAAPEKRSLSGYTEWAHDYQAASRWIGTWRGWTQTITAVTPPVDRLNAILVARDTGNMP